MNNASIDIPEDMAREALYTQSACNVSGLVHSLDSAVSRLWKQAHAEGHGTDWVNKHPVVVLYATQIAHLSRAGSMENWESAVRACEEAAGVNLCEV